jgi:hypothetical protein
MNAIAPAHVMDKTVKVGDIISFPFHQLRVVATEFARNAMFPEAVAQVAIETGAGHDKGCHISTPFGMVEVVSDDRGFDFHDFEDVIDRLLGDDED